MSIQSASRVARMFVILAGAGFLFEAGKVARIYFQFNDDPPQMEYLWGEFLRERWSILVGGFVLVNLGLVGFFWSLANSSSQTSKMRSRRYRAGKGN